MTAEVQAFATGFPLTLLHAAVTLLLLVLGAALYVRFSPPLEIVGAARPSDALSLASVVLGLAAPLAAALSASPSLVEIVLWGGAVVVLQLLLFALIDIWPASMVRRARSGEIGAAAVLAAARLAAGLVLAAAVAG